MPINNNNILEGIIWFKVNCFTYLFIVKCIMVSENGSHSS